MANDSYCTPDEVASYLGGRFDEDIVSALCDKAAAILEGEFALAGKCIDQADPWLLRDCCCDMVASQLRHRVGSDYSDSLDPDTIVSGDMRPSAEYRRLLGIPWRTMRCREVRIG